MTQETLSRLGRLWLTYSGSKCGFLQPSTFSRGCLVVKASLRSCRARAARCWCPGLKDDLTQVLKPTMEFSDGSVITAIVWLYTMAKPRKNVTQRGCIRERSMLWKTFDFLLVQT